MWLALFGFGAGYVWAIIWAVEVFSQAQREEMEKRQEGMTRYDQS